MAHTLSEEAYERMSRAERLEFWQALTRLLRLRGRVRQAHSAHIPVGLSADELDALAELLTNNGCEVEEYA